MTNQSFWMTYIHFHCQKRICTTAILRGELKVTLMRSAIGSPDETETFTCIAQICLLLIFFPTQENSKALVESKTSSIGGSMLTNKNYINLGNQVK